MASNSNIGWCHASWNPITGCSRVSEGCRKCYAERMAGTRLAHHKHYAGLTRISGGEPKWTGDVRFNEDVILQPLRWRKPKRIFVNSMGDLFHESVPDEWLYQVYTIMWLCPQHTFLILTKRPGRMVAFAERLYSDLVNFRPMVWMNAQRLLGGKGEWLRYTSDVVKGLPPNAWHGVSCEDQKTLEKRLIWLLRMPGSRFASLEPLLGAIDLNLWLWRDQEVPYYDGVGVIPQSPSDALDWVIVGGESGKGYRECEVECIADIARQCKAAGVPVFVKQDCGTRPGQQGRIPDDLWALKEVPE